VAKKDKKRSKGKKGPQGPEPWKTTFRIDEFGRPVPLTPESVPRQLTLPAQSLTLETMDEATYKQALDGIFLLQAMETAQELGLLEGDPRDHLRRLGHDPELAELARPEIHRFLLETGGYKGSLPVRAPAPRALSEEASRKAVFTVRDYIIEHPGCVDTSRQRAYYRRDFKEFVVSLISEGGLAAGATLVEAQEITGLPGATLTAWLREARTPPLKADSGENDTM